MNLSSMIGMNTQALLDLSTSIQKLHKALLEFQKQKVEERTGKALNPYEMLGAALNDSEFAWLKPVSQMIVEIDLASETTEDKSTHALEAANSPDFDPEKVKEFWENPPKDFHKHLIEAIQKNPDVSFLFSEVRLQATRI